MRARSRATPSIRWAWTWPPRAGAAEAVASLEEAIRIAREVANADDIGRAYVNLAEAKHYCGDTHGAAEIVREGIVATDEVGISRTYGHFVRENGVAYAFELGDWDRADKLAEESLALQPPGRAPRRYGLTRWVPLLVAQGKEEAGFRLEELRQMVDGATVETQFNTPLRTAAVEAALWRGEPDVALKVAQDGLREVADREWPRYHLRLFRVAVRAAADVAEVARARRDQQREASAILAGAELRSWLEPVLADARARQEGLAAEETAAEVAMIDAELRRLRREPAAPSWREAADRWRARENPYLLAYARWREAEALLGDGDRASATAALGEAHRIATTLGARPLREAIEGLAARSRVELSGDDATTAPVPAPATADPFGLTRRERDVLPLLVKGRTNRQIAEELFISENTAGVHVSNILGKLGASTRAEAAGIAARLGLGTDQRKD